MTEDSAGPMSGLTMLCGPDATADLVGIKTFEEQALAVDAAAELDRQVARALR